MFGKWVDIEFDCLPLRGVTRLDVPVDASPAYEQFVLRVKAALQRHGTHNTYYLHRGKCGFHLTNKADLGEVVFRFEGTVMTDTEDLQTRSVELQIELSKETCSWLNEPSVGFLTECVRQAVTAEFDRFIAAGDLDKTQQRIEAIQKQVEEGGGFVGMYL